MAMPPGGQMPGGMATRAVVEYSALEELLLDGEGRGDRAALEGLLAEEFAYSVPAAPDPIDRQQFVDAAVARREAGTIYALTVLENDTIDVVSYLLRVERARATRPANGTAYVVDVWRHADHRLLARFRSIVRRAPPPPTTPSGRG